MKTIVLYYSKNGSNRYLAHEIAKGLSCDIEEIKARVDVFLLYLMRINLGNRALKNKIDDYEKVILCGPIWMGKLIPPLRSFLLKYKDRIRALDFVTCCGSSDAKKDDKFGHGLVFKEVQHIMQDKCATCQAFPIDLVLPDYQKEDEHSIMNTRLSDETFKGLIRERLDSYLEKVS
jgi:menaquinone-dependent protoporphyrinogen IX oxidase